MNNILNFLEKLIKKKKESKNNTIKNSYTLYLLNKNDDFILKKIGEELTEVILAAKNSRIDNNNKELIYECSDLLYHFSIMLFKFKIKNKNLFLELLRRKNKSGFQEKKDRFDNN
ncbi:phosphoribosyl-ATP diphosphatase [Candidatus Zinderia endosymbiont of Aphrophora alni]|uniref:phosphoribosyl-ATP diphosphatase n=1 Tax=Candidatus Zinderia endosymbiont of Aphrophora alni TaxID=3077951 RepID=UPI0030D4B1A1